MAKGKSILRGFVLLFSINSSFLTIGNNQAHSNLVDFLFKEKNEDKSVVFVKNQRDDDDVALSSSSIDDNSAYLDYYFFFENAGHIQKGEIYRTHSQTDSQIEVLKSEIRANVEKGFYSSKSISNSIYTGAFKIGSDYENINQSTIIRVLDATKGSEKLGTMTDYQNEFVFKNPENKSSLFYVITHETYLSPVQTSNGNYKGVGIQGILDLNSKDTSQIVRDYGPKASQPSATIGFNFGITAEGNVSSQGFGVGARATFGFSYNTNVESPKIVDYGIMPYSSNISFEYVDPGSWFGNFYNYNTHQSFQCILNVLEVSKDRDNISFDQQIKGRFEKYENWAFPWIDETYTISSHVERNVDEIKSLI